MFCVRKEKVDYFLQRVGEGRESYLGGTCHFARAPLLTSSFAREETVRIVRDIKTIS